MSVVLAVEGTPAAAGLVLRPWGAADAGALVEVFRDPALRHWLTRHVDGVEDARSWLEEQRLGWESGNRLSFAVYEPPREGADEGPPVANVVLKRTGAGSGSGSGTGSVSGAVSGTGSGLLEAGYWTAARARGRGVASRALGAVTAWAFEVFAAEGLARIELIHQVDNEASCRVAEKAGFSFERILPAMPPYPLDGHLHVRHAPDGSRTRY
ncbi:MULTISPECIES: GNAT family N-acetyltransferase [unclassified Streptomyces]|uniref:GNAT family N-acetyltransferase n=1 Tax=unclassified Streptomyces TaxID=2593676 RepID=UPI000DC797DD|nr:MULTISPECIES: GNAT family N-acetyltransferase [unclassified Streptomyces]AWZ07952.1 GNAT family N-acetyltransferase [Streptomyces sp. ICC4]AWZ15707.1 GNAT family N-acetyltransferase [Streptomyces sp. ICC1]